jgi:hypothetical protein
VKRESAPETQPTAEEPENAILLLLGEREPGATICPSEVARKIAGPDDWRPRMDDVHAAVDSLHTTGAIALSWKGENLPKRAGPYRIGKRVP